MNSVEILERSILSKHYYQLENVTFQLTTKDGVGEKQSRECYDIGNGAVILLYNLEKNTVILTKQFRMPTYLNQNTTGYMIEACAGKLDGDSPSECVIRETNEEVGYTIENPELLFDLYVSPGAVTEILYFFMCPVTAAQKTHAGGGVAEESENIEILEIDFESALAMVKNGEIKDSKTVILLHQLKLSGRMNKKKD